MNRGNKILVGFVIGAVILGVIGLLLAPSLLGLATVGIGHAVTQTLAVNAALLPIHTWSPGVTAAAFGHLQAGIAVFMGVIGGLAGGLVGANASKPENNTALARDASSSSGTPVTNERTTGYAPSLDVGGQDIEKSFVKNYEQEKLTSLQTPSQWRH